jgi:hypothetical protein
VSLSLVGILYDFYLPGVFTGLFLNLFGGANVCKNLLLLSNLFSFLFFWLVFADLVAGGNELMIPERRINV